jgi:hypothetical protein
MLEAATRRVHNTFNRLNYSGNNLPSYKNSLGPLQCYQQVGFEKTKERSFNVYVCKFSLVEKKSLKSISLEKEDNIKLVEIDVETKIDSFQRR